MAGRRGFGRRRAVAGRWGGSPPDSGQPWGWVEVSVQIGFVGNDAAAGRDSGGLAEALRPLLPPGAALRPTGIAEAAALMAAAAMPIWIIAMDGPNWREDANQLEALIAANPDARVSVFALVPRGDALALTTALELGVADAAGLPIDPHEVRARLAALLKRRQRALARRAEKDAVWRLATIDPVTGLNNRHHLDANLPAAIVSARARGLPLALLMVDIDDLKLFNDRWGHASGDQELKDIAAALKDGVRMTDCVTRVGGDEMVVILPDTDAVTARGLASRLVEAVATRAPRDPGRPHLLTVSVGIAMLADDDTAESLMQRADMALYRAKREGRNRVVGVAA